MIKSAIILCAGFGTRLKPITNIIPKPLVKVNNKEILLYILELLAKSNIKNIVINSHYLSEQIKKFIDKIRFNFNFESIQVIYEPEILDSGGGVKNACKYIDDEEFLVINGDCIYLDDFNNPIELLQKTWNKKNMNILLLLNEKDKAIGYDGKGDFNLDKNIILREKNNQYIFTGMQIINREIIESIDKIKFSLNEIYDLPNSYGVVNLSNWLHIGTEDNLKAANKFLE